MASKDKRRQNKAAKAFSQEISPAQILSKFKSAWACNNALSALTLYRSWINKTGKRSDPEIEGELLLRSAGEMHESSRPEQAIGFLDEAKSKCNTACGKLDYYKAIIFAQTGKLSSALVIFEELHDDFHAAILRSLLDAKKQLPKKINLDERFDRHELLTAWNAIAGGLGTTDGTPSLRNLVAAYASLASGEDPERELVLLKNKAGWKNAAHYLLLLTSVSQRRNIKIRNILKANPELAGTGSWNELMRIHMIMLLTEAKHGEILAIREIMDRSNTHLAGIDRLYDEALFRASLDEIAARNFDGALGYLLRVRIKTQAIKHNMALCCQKLEKYGDANDYWIQLFRSGEKPKKTDPKDIRDAYAETCDHIAQNYREEGNFEKAYAYLKESLFYNEDKDTIREICEICAEMERHDEAFMYAKRLAALEPDNESNLLLCSTEARLSGKTDDIIETLEAFCAKNPENIFFSFYTAMIYADKAWQQWNDRVIGIQELGKRIVYIKRIFPDLHECRLLYLEAVLFEAFGKTKAANAMFKRAIKNVKMHIDEYDLGMALYNDGRNGNALDLFMKTVSCSCEESSLRFEKIISYFIEKEDRISTRFLCDYAIEKNKHHPSTIAEMLLESSWPDLALQYSSMGLSMRDSCINDYFLHLVILNRIGKSEEILEFANVILAKAEEEDEANDIHVIKRIIREVKAKGRFKE